jgi:adenine-specific DNA methylase
MARSLKDILTHQVEQTSALLHEAAETDVDLKVAMTQTITEQSITVQNYRIDIVKEEFAGRQKNFYNIVEGKQVIHSDLALFETAMGIVKKYITNKTSGIKELEQYDNDYSNSLYETWAQQSRANKGGINEDIAIAKASRAKQKVQEAKQRILSRL